MSKNYYIDNKKLETELSCFSDTFKKEVKRIMKEDKIAKKTAEKKAKGYISEELGEMFLAIAYNLSNKNNFNNYTYKEEMIGLGVEYLCRFAKRFDSKKSHNAFSYCTQICYNGFVQAIIKETKRSKLKDCLIKDAMVKSELEKWQQDERDFMYDDNDL